MSQIVVVNEQLWRLVGGLDFTTVGALLTEFTRRLAQSSLQILDLGEVTRTDSAGLAFLIEVRRLTQDKPLIFQNIPPQMLNLAQVSSVENMLIQSSS